MTDPHTLIVRAISDPAQYTERRAQYSEGSTVPRMEDFHDWKARAVVIALAERVDVDLPDRVRAVAFDLGEELKDTLGWGLAREIDQRITATLQGDAAGGEVAP